VLSEFRFGLEVKLRVGMVLGWDGSDLGYHSLKELAQSTIMNATFSSGWKHSQDSENVCLFVFNKQLH
jgi:hypothetical protein